MKSVQWSGLKFSAGSRKDPDDTWMAWIQVQDLASGVFYVDMTKEGFATEGEADIAAEEAHVLVLEIYEKGYGSKIPLN